MTSLERNPENKISLGIGGRRNWQEGALEEEEQRGGGVSAKVLTQPGHPEVEQPEDLSEELLRKLEEPPGSQSESSCPNWTSSTAEEDVKVLGVTAESGPRDETEADDWLVSGRRSSRW